ncbi:MAG TPA: hypothetical protein VK468_05005 [Pyrinomonadaceae bacterium]|nr:hypothetical protein [Pyrinomonadaceae bacterium]
MKEVVVGFTVLKNRLSLAEKRPSLARRQTTFSGKYIWTRNINQVQPLSFGLKVNQNEERKQAQHEPWSASK